MNPSFSVANPGFFLEWLLKNLNYTKFNKKIIWINLKKKKNMNTNTWSFTIYFY